eukprot:scaffold30357_cov116-Isochrysis_galbana.AAC.3
MARRIAVKGSLVGDSGARTATAGLAAVSGCFWCQKASMVTALCCDRSLHVLRLRDGRDMQRGRRIPAVVAM